MRGHPFPFFRVLAFTLVLTVAVDAAEQQADFRLRALVKEFRIQCEGLQPEGAPGRGVLGQLVFGFQGPAFVGRLIAGAARLDLDESDALLPIFGVAADVFGDSGEEAMVVGLVDRGEVVGIVRELVGVPIVVGDDLWDPFFVSPAGRPRAGLKGEVERNLVSVGLLDRRIHHAPVVNARAFLNDVPRCVARRAAKKGKLPRILRLAPIPNAVGGGEGSGGGRGPQADAEQRDEAGFPEITKKPKTKHFH